MTERIYKEFTAFCRCFFYFQSMNDKPTEITSKTRLQDISSKEERQKAFREAKEGKHKENKHLQAVAKNLIPLNERSEEEARAIRRKGAEAVNQLKGERKNAKQILDSLLPLYANKDAISQNDNIPSDVKQQILDKNIKITQYDLIMLSMIHRAQNGDVKASEFIANRFGDIVQKDIKVTETMSESDKKLIEKLSNRLNIVDVD